MPLARQSQEEQGKRAQTGTRLATGAEAIGPGLGVGHDAFVEQAAGLDLVQKYQNPAQLTSER